jgi:uncharacterized protein YycO
MKALFFQVIFFTSILSFTQSSAQGNNYQLKEGDIVLQKIPCGGLCDAIIETTPCAPDRMFNHCGIVHFDGNRAYVIEAIGKKVQQNPLDTFLKRESDAKTLYVARLKPQYASYIEPAVRKASIYLGTPYDDAFVPGDDALYCSELVYKAYKKDNTPNLFPLAPMTFKSKSGKTFPAWTEYYKDIKHEIPEGEPGINPCAIANSNAITLLTIQR